MNVNETPDNEPLEDLPPEILAALAEDAKIGPLVSEQRDQAILAAAHAKLDLPTPRILRPKFRLGRWLAAAAAIAICFAVFYRPGHEMHDAAILVSAPETDFNGDTTVDILDVMLLARRIQANSDIPTAGDINRDGTINQADVDALAADLVRLDNPI